MDYALPPTVKDLVDALSSNAFVRYLEKLTKIDGLIADHSHSKAMHLGLTGGFINLHMDPNVHPDDRHLKRQVNLLLYINENWQESYGGVLEIWNKSVTKCLGKVHPLFNKCIVFTTTKVMHGFPDPITCPEDEGRKVIIMYYFTREEDRIPIKITDYKARPRDPISIKVKVLCGRALLHTFYFLRDNFNVKQEHAGQITKFLDRFFSKTKNTNNTKH